MTSTAPIYTAPMNPIALPKDNTFGYALPEGTKLSSGIEASPDLIHWSPLTNLSLYFKDRDSTNFIQRYYRFPE